MLGRTIEQFRIESKIGEGGMGVVYKGYDSRLDRPVAIKILSPDRIADPAGKKRFVLEAKAASGLNHPGIVTIYDIRSDEGTDLIVMEYIVGETLDALISGQGLRTTEVIGYGIQIADALAAAHGAGIIHRDLKPSNLMVTRDGRIKILDFGLAKLIAGDESPSDSTTVAAALTDDRVVVGTAAYMSPEQAEGRKLDTRSDIFSFGAVLYEMTTGQRPFSGESWLALLANILNEEPKPPRDLVTSVPPELEKIILRCLRKDPARRYQTMADLRAAFEDLKAELVSGAALRVPSPRPSWWRWAVVALVPMSVALGYFSWQSGRLVEPIAPLQTEPLTTFPGQELYPSLSPEGDRVVFTWTGPRQDNTDVWVQQIGAGDPLRLTTDLQDDYNPVWSPDGRWVVFLRGDPATPLARSEREVRLIAPLGGPERRLANVRVQEITVNPMYLAWCPDSTCVIVTDSLGEGRPDGLVVIALETGEKRPLTSPQPPALADTNPALSPDGRSLLFIRRATWGLGVLHALPLGTYVTATGEPKPIATPGVRPETAAWLPSGREILLSTIAFAGGTALWRLPADGSQRPARVPFVGEDGVMPALSRPAPGRPAHLVYVRSFTDENIWRVNTAAVGTPAEASPTVAIASTRSDIHPSLSPDGQRVAFTSTRAGSWEIWVSNLDGANTVKLTSLSAPTGTGAPRWSPDGGLIALASDAEQQFDIFVVPSGGGKPRNMTSHASFDHVPCFSRDGKWIYFSSARSGQFQVWKVPAAGGEAVQVTKDGGWLSRESPDGAFLYFTKTPAIGALTQMWRMPTAGGPAVKTFDGILNAAFTVVDRGIYHIGRSANEASLRFFDFATGRTVTIAQNLGLGADHGGFDASGDGRTLLFGRLDASVDDLMVVKDFR